LSYLAHSWFIKGVLIHLPVEPYKYRSRVARATHLKNGVASRLHIDNLGSKLVLRGPCPFFQNSNEEPANER
jgi:hypothetical protein